MTDRIKLLIQKRTSLKSQITNLTNLLEKDRHGHHDKAALKARMDRVTELFHAYEDYNDELLTLDSNENHKDEFANVQDRFYSLLIRVRTLTDSIQSVANTSMGIDAPSPVDTASTVVNHKMKLPKVSLPNFDGSYEKWLSFKNAFIAMIDSRTDLSDVEKLQYLQSAVTGEAANKIKILSIESANYSRAWELLKRAYEVKRIIISRHLSLINNLPILEKETTEGLSKLADDAQQHVASLAAMGVSIGSEMLVNILERKLPKNTADKWEETLGRDEFPKIDELYEFLYRSAVRVSKRVRPEASRLDDKSSSSVKKPRTSNKAFAINTANSCIACKNKQHPLYKCDKFKQLDASKRIEIVRNARLCYNCLRSHKGKPCNYANCTICQKRHNTLLHLDKYPSVTTKIDAADSKTDKTS
ncbi:PREDICTED: uncharacterized protein LOC108780531 [Cyphomyrmex costatus]|uniref:uncharacterized protein LOC108777246 n=1 Tax=Cyphomyrmex costatus TaxID=456900 RepID=UPI0008522E89|nr:PREDICTED: uncharacterized protein LOC108777246 [Cyphomyrmex costatus]XP_018403788.1 PREDICTED: uncharacterized protein LOC108780531 [Cyphomyrmex costatus]